MSFSNDDRTSIIDSIEDVQLAVHDNAVAHGFWEGKGFTDGEKICLMHQELSELFDGVRDGNLENPCDKDITKADGTRLSVAEEEAADLVIRLMDWCEHHNINLGEAILCKHEYNIGRPYKHGRTAY